MNAEEVVPGDLIELCRGGNLRNSDDLFAVTGIAWNQSGSIVLTGYSLMDGTMLTLPPARPDLGLNVWAIERRV